MPGAEPIQGREYYRGVPPNANELAQRCYPHQARRSRSRRTTLSSTPATAVAARSTPWCVSRPRARPAAQLVTTERPRTLICLARAIKPREPSIYQPRPLLAAAASRPRQGSHSTAQRPRHRHLQKPRFPTRGPSRPPGFGAPDHTMPPRREGATLPEASGRAGGSER